ncbi:MAG: alpha-galactosidase [Pseudonocardiales bacterium]|jgi:alpha-galactosidase|nr:alpha-galactosidase [Pseudonocardiales bacterium]
MVVERWLPIRWIHGLVAATIGGALVATLGVVGVVTATSASAGTGATTTPPMGWNDWNAFGCNVSADLIEKTAKAMVDDGMAAAGYKYVNIDDCWMDGNQYPQGRGPGTTTDPRRATAGRVDGHLVADPRNFPGGIRPVADYVHSLGLKLGIYESAGATTCQGLAGSYGHELTDAEDFASWGVDYLKYDNCGTVAGTADNQAEYIARYKAMGDALKQASADSGHAIVYSVCEWGNYEPWSWAADQAEADLWRTTTDISDSWASTVSLFKQNVVLSSYSRPGAANDPDMLEIGNGGQTDTEYRSQFSLWSMMAAPLISGTPLAEAGGKSAASAATLAIYENSDVIAVDQDTLGAAATVYSHTGKQWTLVRPLANGDEAVLLFNESDAPTTQSVSLPAVLGPAKSAYLARDLWAHSDATVAGTLHADVEPHGVRMFRVSAGATPSDAAAHVTLSATARNTYLESGTSTVLSETLFNDGRDAINHAIVGLSAVPAGWTVTPLAPAGRSVPGQSATTATWRVSVPAGTAAGNYAIEASAAYEGRGGEPRTTMSTITIVVPPAPPTTTAYLSDVNWVSVSGSVYKDQQVSRGIPSALVIAGQTFPKGLGASSGSDVAYYLGGHCSTLSVVAGIDDSASTSRGTPTANIAIILDGVPVYQGIVTKGTAVPLTQQIAGTTVLELSVDPSTGFGSTPVDWANAQVHCS